MQGSLFEPEPPPPPRPRHYAWLLAETDQNYGLLSRAERGRVGALAGRLKANEIPERNIPAQGAYLRAALGRTPTLAELADRLLG